VKLTTADQHAAELDQLARVAPEPIRLGVDHQEFRARDRLLE
jgi:hypothetical protein